MRIAKIMLTLSLLFFSTFTLATTITKEMQSALTPDQVLQMLQDGNGRFVAGTMKNRDLLAQARKSSTGQYPIAVVLSCLDSRVAPEIIFDQGIGDLFVARIAGNIQNKDILGSMEFATQLSGAKLIAVIGHSHCGAVRGACQQAQLGNLTGLLQKIQPAVTEAAAINKKDCSNNDFIDEAAKDNVRLVMKQIPENSPIIKKLIQEGKIKLVGGMQDFATGKVTFFETNS